MSLPEIVKQKVPKAIALLERNEWIVKLLVRLFLGYFFLETGWGKIHNIEGMTERFTEWGIPFPAFNAVLSGYTEFLGGALVMVGFLTRLVSIPLVINMIVATITVKLKAVEDLSGFVELDEPLYALGFLWLLFAGPGLASIDHLIAKRILTQKTE